MGSKRWALLCPPCPSLLLRGHPWCSWVALLCPPCRDPAVSLSWAVGGRFRGPCGTAQLCCAQGREPGARHTPPISWGTNLSKPCDTCGERCAPLSLPQLIPAKGTAARAVGAAPASSHRAEFHPASPQHRCTCPETPVTEHQAVGGGKSADPCSFHRRIF